jgi:hypothetical protein
MYPHDLVSVPEVQSILDAGDVLMENLNVFGDAERALLDRLIDAESKLAMCVGCLITLRDYADGNDEHALDAINNVLKIVMPQNVDVEKV